MYNLNLKDFLSRKKSESVLDFSNLDKMPFSDELIKKREIIVEEDKKVKAKVLKKRISSGCLSDLFTRKKTESVLDFSNLDRMPFSHVRVKKRREFDDFGLGREESKEVELEKRLLRELAKEKKERELFVLNNKERCRLKKEEKVRKLRRILREQNPNLKTEEIEEKVENYFILLKFRKENKQKVKLNKVRMKRERLKSESESEFSTSSMSEDKSKEKVKETQTRRLPTIRTKEEV